MHIVWLGHRLYLTVSLIIFLWTLSYQSVTLHDFRVPFVEYSAVVFAVRICAALPLTFLITVKLFVDSETRNSLRVPFDKSVVQSIALYLAGNPPKN